MVSFETLVSRSMVRFISEELDLAGLKMSVDRFLQIAIVGGFVCLIAFSFGSVIIGGLSVVFGGLLGLGVAGIYEIALYAILEYLIDKRKSFIESILPDFIQLTAANLRSGVSLDKALISASKPEFLYFNDDIQLMTRQLYAGETMRNALLALSNRYRSIQFKRTSRMIAESLRYGGSMADILNQIARDLRNQLTIQKEIAGQLFMYTIFITFAAIIAAPVLFGLTSRMISITDCIWGRISAQGVGSLAVLQQSSILSLTPHPPSITPDQYYIFALVALSIISAMSAFIVSSISTGSAIKGIRYLPIFVVVALVMFYATYVIFGSVLGHVTVAAC